MLVWGSANLYTSATPRAANGVVNFNSKLNKSLFALGAMEAATEPCFGPKWAVNRPEP